MKKLIQLLFLTSAVPAFAYAQSVTLAVDTALINEAGGTATFTATLDEETALPVSVNLGFSGTATGAGVDYTASGTSITISAGSLSGSVTVTAVDDSQTESDETIVVSILSVIYAVIGNPNQATTTIVDDDPSGVASETDAALPKSARLEQNYPNPFNPRTTISYQLAQSGRVELAIYNLLGERIATLEDAVKPAGEHETTFNAAEITSGIYFYTLTAGNFTESRKMVLLR